MKGTLHLVGMGPGDLSLLPEMARRAIEASDVVTGYALYLDLLRPLLEGKEVLEGMMTKEEERAALAIDKCLEGKNVALISSGDIGIYGMASLVYELLEKRAAALDVWVIPGISALNAAAALLGAPLNHDFCAISLSDLLTPWPLIERRIEAAAAGDFVVALYNPKSEKRDWQLKKAAEIVSRYRKETTPVGLVKNAYRKGQDVRWITLAELPAAEVDMLTTVIVGNSQTRRSNKAMFTPRGYLTRSSASLVQESLPASDPITQESFRITQEELGEHGFTPEELAVVIRVVHSTGDFAFASLLRFQNHFFEAMARALQSGRPIVTDVEMTRSGIGRVLPGSEHDEPICLLNEKGVREEAARAGMTRSAMGMRKALEKYPEAICVIGNAPTALLEVISQTNAGKAKPSAVIGVPVGFVSVVASKEALLKTSLPSCTVLGRRGGSPVAAAVINACLRLAREKVGVA